jgi:DNA-binding beta-propeller fold protein YncE
MRAALAPLYEKYHVDLVLQGHDHVYSRSHKVAGDRVVAPEAPGVIYAISVSGPKMYKLEPRHSELMSKQITQKQFFQVIEVSPDMLKFTAYSIDNAVADAFELRKNGKGTLYVNLAPAGGEKMYRVETRYPVPGAGGWDYITVDSVARRLYASHGTEVDVLDADSGKAVGVIADTPGVHGAAIARELGFGFTSNGKEDKVSQFDTATLKLIRKIDVGKGPDGIYFDSASKRVFTCNHGSHDISAIDAATGQLVGTVAAGGDGEQMAAGGDGMLYVNLEDTSEVVSFDPRTLEVVRRFPIEAGKTPTGLAIDVKNNRLFIGCRSKSLVVMDAASGKVIASLPIGAGVDAAAFDADSRFVFASNGDGTLSVIRQKSADEYEDAGVVVTQPGAKTMAFDTVTKRIFLPVAEFDVIAPADASQKPQRKIRPGTFTILVAGRIIAPVE